MRKKAIFWFALPPLPQDKTASNNSPPLGTKVLTCPRDCPGVVVTGGIEPRIISSPLENLASKRVFKGMA